MTDSHDPKEHGQENGKENRKDQAEKPVESRDVEALHHAGRS